MPKMRKALVKSTVLIVMKVTGSRKYKFNEEIFSSRRVPKQGNTLRLVLYSVVKLAHNWTTKPIRTIVQE